MAKERIQKILSRAGISSRRKAEDLIRMGEVTINGKVAKLGDKGEFGTDAIKVSGKLIHSQEPPIYYAFNKPAKVVSSLADPQGRPTIADYIGKLGKRIYPIGRLDFMSEGLILLTNDGDFAQQLQTRKDILRVYRVKVADHPTADQLERLQRGGRFQVTGFDESQRPENRVLKPFSVHLDQNFNQKSSIIIAVAESGAVDVAAYFKSKGFLVNRIVRIAIGHITLGGLDPGELRLLRDSQVKAILTQPELGTRELENIKKDAAPVREETEIKSSTVIKPRTGDADGTRGGNKVIRRPGRPRISPVSPRGSHSGESDRPRKVIKPLDSPAPRSTFGQDDGEGPRRSPIRPRPAGNRDGDRAPREGGFGRGRTFGGSSRPSGKRPGGPSPRGGRGGFRSRKSF